jgi:uncharacterized protein
MEINLSKIKKISEVRKDENWEFRSFLENCTISSRILDKIVHKLYKDISGEIDCTACGNCCREKSPALNREEIERLSKARGISVGQFEEQYLVKIELDVEFKDEYRFKMKPCPFHRENKCMYYEYRPDACISYPHLHKKHFRSRITTAIKNYPVCPIVFNVYEKLKDKVWRR